MATQLCPCGYLGHPKRACDCTPVQVHRYRAKVSGPLLDRIDLQVEVGPLQFEEWAGETPPAETSASIRARVESARAAQAARLGPARTNASMSAAEVKAHVPLRTQERALLETAADRLGLSARSLDRVARLARTIADLAGEPAVRRSQLAEAIQYRTLDRSAGMA